MKVSIYFSIIGFDSFDEMNKSSMIKLDLVKLENDIKLSTLKHNTQETEETKELIRRDPETYSFV